MSTRKPITPAGIEPATFRFVAQHLNHCAIAVPKEMNVISCHTGAFIRPLPLPRAAMLQRAQTQTQGN